MRFSSDLIQPMAAQIVPVAASAFVREFPVQQQLMSNWCWAASTLALCNFYRDTSVPSQRQFVARNLNMPICASPRPVPPCNKLFDFGIALAHARHLHGAPIDGTLDPRDLDDALRRFGPVGCQLLIPRIGGHAVVVVEGNMDPQGNLFLRVADPGDAKIVTMPFAQFRNNYRGMNGRWIRTYLTQPINQ